MAMTVGIKSSDERDLDLHFYSPNSEGNGKYGSLHITICAMQQIHGQHVPVYSLSCKLDHDDIDKLIKELQAAKALLTGDRDDATVDGSWLGPVFPDMMTLFKPEAICLQCGYRADRHSYSGACIERLPCTSMIRFSKTERFRA